MNNSIILQEIESFEAKIKMYLENRNDFFYNPLECYIMKNEYKTVLVTRSSRKNLISSTKEINQYFIDNFNDAIKYLKISSHLEYTNKEIMETFLDKNDLNNLHNISYVYIFKKKIIIDFNNYNCNKSILIIPSREGYFDNEIIFIISHNYKYFEKKELFESLLNEDIKDLSDVETIKEKYKDNLEEIEDYLNNLIDGVICECGCNNIYHNKNRIEKIKQNIEILIMIYYYEKLVKNKDMPDSIYYNYYYLVESKWIEKYKNYYYYNDLSKLLDKEIDNNIINFNNLYKYQRKLTEKYFEEYINLVPENVLLNNGFIYRKEIKAPLNIINNLNYYNECYIIPGKIFKLITNLEYNKTPSELKIYTTEISSNNGIILIKIDSTNLNLGNMDGLLFNIKYIISFFSQTDFNDFKDNYLFKKSINQYLTQFYCNEESNEIQIMKNNKGTKIGISLKPDLNSLKSQLFTQKISCDISPCLRNQYIYQSRYSPISKINRYSNRKHFTLNKNAEIKTYKDIGIQLDEDDQNKDEKNKINEDYQNKEKELNEEKKKIIEEYKIKEKELNEEKNKIIEEYKIKEKKNKIIEEYKIKEKELNEEKNKIIDEYKIKENKLNDKILEYEKNKKIIEEYKIKEKELNEEKNKIIEEYKIKENKLNEEKNKIIEEFRNKEEELNENNKKIIENYKNKEKELIEENKKIIEEYKIKEKELNEEKNKIIEEYKIKENKLNEVENKIIKDYKIKENELNDKILEFEKKIKIIEEKEKNLNEEKNKIIKEYKIKEKKLTDNILILEKKDKENKIKMEEQSRKEIGYEAIISDLKLKIQLKDNNIKEMTNLEKEHKELQNKFNEHELKIKELEKKIKDQENVINQLNPTNERNFKSPETNPKKFLIENSNSNNNSNFYINPYNNYSNNSNNNFINFNNNNNIYSKNISINTSIYSNNIYTNNYINNNLMQFNKTHLVGLKDVSAKKFINPILQCFSQTMPLTKYFFNLNNMSKILNQNNLKLSPLYLELNESLWNNLNGSNIYEPCALIKMIENENYNNLKIEKAKDLISFIIDKLNEELSQPNKLNSSQNNKINKYDKNKIFENFFNNFKQKTSIISEIFFGFKESKNECLNCKRIYKSQGLDNPIYYTYESFKYLIFPLEKIKEMKNSNNVSIYDCFEYNQRNSILKGNDCDNCKKIWDLNILSRILVGPNILIIILENENNNPYIKLDIKFTIDLSNFIIKKDKNNPKMKYDLYGIFSYFENDNLSPYMACCLNQNDNHWYKFNNENINQINDIQKDFIESGTPSILFYKKQYYNSDIFNNLINN